MATKACRFLINTTFGKVGQKYFFQPCKDPKTDTYPDHIRPVNSNGDMILSEEDKMLQSKGKIFFPENKIFEIECPKEFDMSKPMDKAIWEAIQFTPGIASSRFEKDKNGDFIIDGNDKKYGIAELYVENPTLESEKAVSKSKKIFDAQSCVFNDPRGVEGHRLMVDIIGRNMDHYDDPDVTDYLLKLCEKQPERIISLYSSSDLSIRFLFVEARKSNVIRMKNKVYVFGSEGQIILGPTDDSVISFLKSPKNKKILEMVEREVNPLMFNNSGKSSDNKVYDDDNSNDGLVLENNNSDDNDVVSKEEDLFDNEKESFGSVDEILAANKSKRARK